MTTERLSILSGGPPVDDRDDRLADGAADLAGGERTGLLANQHLLLVISGMLMAGGLVAVLLGYLGASSSIQIEAQVPYLISGGLLGVCLSIIGSITFFAHWLTALIREVRGVREDHQELMVALREMTAAGTAPAPRRRRSS